MKRAHQPYQVVKAKSLLNFLASRLKLWKQTESKTKFQNWKLHVEFIRSSRRQLLARF